MIIINPADILRKPSYIKDFTAILLFANQLDKFLKTLKSEKVNEVNIKLIKHLGL